MRRGVFLIVAYTLSPHSAFPDIFIVALHFHSAETLMVNNSKIPLKIISFKIYLVRHEATVSDLVSHSGAISTGG